MDPSHPRSASADFALLGLPFAAIDRPRHGVSNPTGPAEAEPPCSRVDLREEVRPESDGDRRLGVWCHPMGRHFEHLVVVGGTPTDAASPGSFQASGIPRLEGPPRFSTVAIMRRLKSPGREAQFADHLPATANVAVIWIAPVRSDVEPCRAGGRARCRQSQSCRHFSPALYASIKGCKDACVLWLDARVSANACLCDRSIPVILQRVQYLLTAAAKRASRADLVGELLLVAASLKRKNSAPRQTACFFEARSSIGVQLL